MLEDSDNHERWLVSYADLMTLLFAFFVVMYAISSVNEGKYKVLSDSLNKVFSDTNLSTELMQTGEPAQHSAPSVIDFQQSAKSVDTEQGDSYTKEIEDKIRERFAGLLNEDAFDVETGEDWMEITLPAQLLFGSGAANFRSGNEKLVAELMAGIVAVIGPLEEPLSVEGFTDNVPLAGGVFPTNWELAGARAATVARALIDNGIDPARVSAVSYGENYPLATNATAAGRASNRRVALVIDRSDDSRRGRFREPLLPVVLVEDDPLGAEDAAVLGNRTRSGGLIFSNN